MIGLANRSQVFAYAKPTDLRKSFDALAELVRTEMDRDPLCGDAFLFVNRRRTLTKCLVYDGTGMRLTIKRLTKGRFAAPWLRDDDVVAMTAAELSLFFEGSPFVFAGALSPRPIGTSSVVARSLSV
ncbi:MAG: IS66 family insertion sequence element accessory protein TnpB [Parvibaculum sp.]